MKSLSASLAAAALLQLSAASPFPRAENDKRGVFTTIEYVTIQAPDVVIYADEFGNPTATSIVAPEVVVETAVTVIVTPTAAAANAPPAIAAPTITSNNFNVANPTPAAPVSPPPPPPPVEAIVSEDVQANSRFTVQKSNGYGISWTPFNGEEGNTSCKSQEQTDDEFQQIHQAGFTKVRIYGVGCNQVALAMKSAARYGMTLMLGVWDIDTVAGETGNLVDQVYSTGLPWDMIETISIGNEDVEKGRGVADVKAAVSIARHVLRDGGYNGPVVHVDTAGAILRHPSLCGSAGGDFVAANIHPFFNPAIMPKTAGFFVQAQVGLLRACSALHSRKRSTHRVLVAETGWPNAGSSNGLAVPGREHQLAAIKSIKHALPTDVYFYSAFDNRWLRDNAGTFGVEKHWGLFN